MNTRLMDANAVKYFGDFIVGITYSENGLQLAVNAFYLNEEERKRVEKKFPDFLEGESMRLNFIQPGNNFEETKKEAINSISNIEAAVNIPYVKKAIDYLKKFDYHKGNIIEKDDSALLYENGDNIRIIRRIGPTSLKPSKFIECMDLEMKFREDGGIFKKGMYTEILSALYDEAVSYINRARLLIEQNDDKRLIYRDYERARRILEYCYNKSVKICPDEQSVENISTRYAECLYNRASTANDLYGDLGKKIRMFERTLTELNQIEEIYEDFFDYEEVLDSQIYEMVERAQSSVMDGIKEEHHFFQINNYIRSKQTLSEIPRMERLKFIRENEEFIKFYRQQLKKLNEIGNERDFLGFKVKGSFIF